MYYVYILKSVHSNQIYTGYTTDLQKRIKEHNSGKSVHTNKFRPWKLKTYLGFEEETKARKFEEYLKTGSGIAFSRRHLL
jgi:putative endonuclease